MPGAGFYSIHTSEIRFGRDGCWYADGERISNERIASFFSRHLERRGDGQWVIRVGREEVPVQVEDTPFVVTTVQERDDRVLVELNDGTAEKLDPSTLRVGPGNVLYCRVKNGSEEARFLRAPYYALVGRIRELGPGRFCFVADGQEHVIELP